MTKIITKEVLEWVKTIAVSVVIAFGITLVVQPTIVDGQSMYPTLENKDYLFVNKLAYNKDIPERGDVLVFKSDLVNEKNNSKKNLVKRVIALPGEQIVIKSNEVYINNQKLNESYLQGATTDGDIDLVVPKNEVFTMGDNRGGSKDSRDSSIGTISIDNIVGKVAFRAFPFNKIGTID
ncbi:signal peptidase I [Romboutsia weinsteinii]|uniref:Signal peptidase I n=1 Tax=Romboutsia weinsteinii TaxID=2020949 RepID=A0A371J3P7_9FIRM|nr:signal peptidase I [Romboutsia weinsteinii]RDY27296.1 signal peptidase I [Romboutsia weinsteinii]